MLKWVEQQKCRSSTQSLYTTISKVVFILYFKTSGLVLCDLSQVNIAVYFFSKMTKSQRGDQDPFKGSRCEIFQINTKNLTCYTNMHASLYQIQSDYFYKIFKGSIN